MSQVYGAGPVSVKKNIWTCSHDRMVLALGRERTYSVFVDDILDGNLTCSRQEM